MPGIILSLLSFISSISYQPTISPTQQKAATAWRIGDGCLVRATLLKGHTDRAGLGLIPRYGPGTKFGVAAYRSVPFLPLRHRISIGPHGLSSAPVREVSHRVR